MATIALTSMLAHSTLFGKPDLPNNVMFLLREGQELQTMVAPWFGVLFWGVGAFSLFATSMGIIDYTSRLAADILKTTYMRGSTRPRAASTSGWSGAWSRSADDHPAGFNQPLVLLVISACTGGAIMFLYSFLLIVLNRNALPAAIRPTPFRVATLVWSTLFFGILSALTIWQQMQRLHVNLRRTVGRGTRDRLRTSDCRLPRPLLAAPGPE